MLSEKPCHGPRPVAGSNPRYALANRIGAFAPDRSFGMCRISTRPCFQVENGMRQSVFSFCIAQPELRLYRVNHFARQVLRALFK